MKYTSFHEDQFRQSVNKALIQIRHLLDNERSSTTLSAATAQPSSLSSGVGLAGDAPNLHEHSYVDKFTLCECMTNTMIASLMNLFTLQLDGDDGGSGGDGGTTGSTSGTAGGVAVPIFDIQPHQLQQILSWVHGNHGSTPMKDAGGGIDQKKAAAAESVASSPSLKKQTLTLRFIAEDTCTLLKEEETQLISHDDREYVTTSSTATSSKSNSLLPVFGSGNKQHQLEETTTTSTKVVHRIKEYHWKIGLRYKIIIFPGTSIDQKIVLHERITQSIIVTQGGGNTAESSSKNRPIAERTIHPPIDTYCLSYLFSMIDPIHQSSTFSIDRNTSSTETTKTPRRNKQIEHMIECLQQLQEWSNITQGFFLQRIEKEIMSKHNPVNRNVHKSSTLISSVLEPGTIGMMQGLTKEPTFNGKQIRIVEYYHESQRYKAEPYNLNEGLPNTLSIKRNNIVVPMDDVDTTNGTVNYTAPPLQSISDETIVCPILPLMDHGNVLSMNEIGYLLQEHTRTIEMCLANLSQTYPSKQLFKLISISEASIVLACKHIHRMIAQYFSSIQYVEDLLQQQLVAAIGKYVDHHDFQSYMKYHYSRFYHSDYGPIPFSHPIRRPQHYPDGIISIESVTGNGPNAPIETWVRYIPGSDHENVDVPSTYMPIDASISIEISGDRFLHGWMQHQFYNTSTKNTRMTKTSQSLVTPAEPMSTEYQLTCRARQFSSFIIILGSMAGPTKFEPKDAIIVQNKDEVLIPLITTILPSAKEFKDAIQSLSPEQQDFAKSYRTMQLESSVFGICIIQIKPQLERLLGLPDQTLTKEIQLTQDIMSLFVDYQVPSDLMTYDGSPESTNNEKIIVVKNHVGAILQVIDDSKTKQLKEEAMRFDMRAEMSYSGPTDGESNMMELERVAVDAGTSSIDTGLDTSRRSRGGLYRVRRLAGAPISRSAVMPKTMASAKETTVSSAPVRKNQKFSRKSVISLSTELGMEQQKLVIVQDISKAEQHETSTTATDQQVDVTMIPKVLDSKLEKYDSDHSLHSVIIKAGTNWTRTRQLNFLTNAQTIHLSSDEKCCEKTQAYALLDALSRSGTLPIACSELHVFVAVSHCFENDVMGTVIQDNINPIVKVERSSLLLASTIHGQPIPSLIEHDHDLERITEAFPSLVSSHVELSEATANLTAAVS